MPYVQVPAIGVGSSAAPPERGFVWPPTSEGLISRLSPPSCGLWGDRSPGCPSGWASPGPKQGQTLLGRVKDGSPEGQPALVGSHRPSSSRPPLRYRCPTWVGWTSLHTSPAPPPPARPGSHSKGACGPRELAARSQVHTSAPHCVLAPPPRPLHPRMQFHSGDPRGSKPQGQEVEGGCWGAAYKDLCLGR